MFKVDLHTHSTASPDGGISQSQYRKAFDQGIVDCVAITDHNRIDIAERLKNEFGEKIIIGEEIMSSNGEIIGLYLNKVVQPGLSPIETVKRIKDQGGLVYIPHPFETFRKGLHPAVLDKLTDYIDFIEVCNGRTFLQNRSAQAVVWAKLNQALGIASSDAHGLKGLGKTYTQLNALPERDTILELCASGIPRTGRPNLRGLLYPKYHRMRKKLRRED
jgi:predicted metal-dependent phosphoesterase TrpH